MLTPEEEYKQLAELAESQKQEKARLKGAMDSMGKSLKDKGFKSPADATTKINLMKTQVAKLKARYQALTKAFREKYQDHFNA